MVGLPFDLPKNNKRKNIYYSVGNPMGAYSSWASFALAHHYVIYYCCRELNKDWKSLSYSLLGDDIAIGDPEVGELYIKVITQFLGVEVSLAKTHQSFHFFEFAKRYFLHRVEITFFPVSALKESAKRYYQLVNLLIESEQKGWVTNFGIPPAISTYYEIVEQYNSRRRKVLQDKSYISERIMKIMRGLISASDGLNDIIRQFNYPIKQLTDEEAHNVLQNVVVECFADQNPNNSSETSGGSKPLGELAIVLVSHFDSFGDSDVEKQTIGQKLIDCFPLLNCYGKVEEKYLEISRKAIQIDTINGGD